MNTCCQRIHERYFQLRLVKLHSYFQRYSKVALNEVKKARPENISIQLGFPNALSVTQCFFKQDIVISHSKLKFWLLPAEMAHW